jgi:hypothetical protein
MCVGQADSNCDTGQFHGHSTCLCQAGAVSSPDGAYPLEPGDRMLLWCEGGPSRSRLVTFPPPLEIDERGGIYVLVDHGPPQGWHYQFVVHRLD